MFALKVWSVRSDIISARPERPARTGEVHMQVSLHKLAHHHHTAHGSGGKYITATGFQGGFYIEAGLPMIAGCDRCDANCSPNGAHYEPGGVVVCGLCTSHEWPSVAAAAADLANYRKLYE